MSKREKKKEPYQEEKSFQHDFRTTPQDIHKGEVLSRPMLILVGVVFLLLLAVYIKVIMLTALGPKFYNFDFVERFRILGVDDTYRYYFAKSVWSDADLYSWSYIQPVGLLIDGSILKIVGKSLFSLRCAHAVFNIVGLFLLFMAGVRLGIRPLVMLFSMLVIALMPLYLLISISVLGECWLLFFVCLSIFLFVHERWFACAITVSFLPLIRPEGAYILGPLFLFFLLRKDLRLALILFVPGLFYLLYLFITLESISYYFEWRLSLRYLLDMVRNPLLYRFGMASTFNPLWFVPAVAAFSLPKMRRVWPFCLGAILATAAFMLLLSFKLANYEPRYLVFIMPICALGAGVLFQYLAGLKIFAFQKYGLSFVFLAIFVITIAENSLQIDWLRSRYGGGERWPFPGISPRPISLEVYDQSRVAQRTALAETIYKAVVKFPKIDSLLVYDPEVLLALDPAYFPRPLKVVLLQIDQPTASEFLDNKIVGLFPGGKQYANFSIYPVEDAAAVNGVYVGAIKCSSCVPLFKNGGFTAYEVRYERYEAPFKRGWLNL